MYPILVVIMYPQNSILTLRPLFFFFFFFSLAGYSTPGFTCDMFPLVTITSGRGKYSLGTRGVIPVVATGVPALMIGATSGSESALHIGCVSGFKIRGLGEMAVSVCTTNL